MGEGGKCVLGVLGGGRRYLKDEAVDLGRKCVAGVLGVGVGCVCKGESAGKWEGPEAPDPVGKLPAGTQAVNVWLHGQPRGRVRKGPKGGYAGPFSSRVKVAAPWLPQPVPLRAAMGVSLLRTLCWGLAG